MIFPVARTHRHRRVLLGVGLVALAVFLALPLTAQTGRVVIVQTNSAGDSVSLIDPNYRQDRGGDPECRSDSWGRGGT